MKRAALSIKIGVSACLLGEHVRYDVGHKLDRNITDKLGGHFSFVPICPEVGCGLSVPREVMRLEGDPVAPRLVTVRTRVDLTERMKTYCAAKATELDAAGVCGFIFKERSPSCGLVDAPLTVCGDPDLFVAGLFASTMTKSFPLMPLEAAERLSNPIIRNNFVERVILFHQEQRS